MRQEFRQTKEMDRCNHYYYAMGKSFIKNRKQSLNQAGNRCHERIEMGALKERYEANRIKELPQQTP